MKKMKRVTVTLACLKCKYVVLATCRNRFWQDGGKSILVLHRLSGISIHTRDCLYLLPMVPRYHWAWRDRIKHWYLFCSQMQCDYNGIEHFLDSLTINTKNFDGYPIVYHKSSIKEMSKGSSIWNLEVNEYLVHLRKYFDEFIFPLNHPTQSKEDFVQDIATCSTTGRSEDDVSNLVSLRSIDILPINRDILNFFEGSNRKGNSHITLVVGDNSYPISCQ